ncbi:hypothetical protein [Methanoregula formicica]|uniref:Uncharacterized protein n=1 Tax=Methanoregula formicica (strain DSM 22288 / NBRC 105244 / SMSP) TaxID=593750 RepID=L0HL27_METFS|nr:hypothetical protein [Methanoregula formicica]AGB03759.1 hypothetical protein Metfor_2776 [Methanoregula formicica SMSP]
MDILANEPFGSISSIRNLASAAPNNRTAPGSTGWYESYNRGTSRTGGEPGNPLPCQ